MIDILQIIIVVGIIIVFGTVITIINIKNKSKTPTIKEQGSWQKIEELNEKKKELLKKKEELSFKYSAKSIDDNTYNKALKYITEEIQKIDDEVNEEVSKLTDLQKKQETGNELRFENIKLKGKLSEVTIEKEALTTRLKELDAFIKRMGGAEKKDLPVCETSKNKYYEIILNKYKDQINQQEKKTITEIKNMIDPGNLTINTIVSKHKPLGYDYNKDYLITLKKIYNYLMSEIDVVKNNLRVLFWLEFSEIIKNKIADEQDISILLCSIMNALNDYETYIYIVQLENEKTHAIVKTKYKNTHYIFDLTQKVPFDMFKAKDEEELFENYKFLDNKIVKKIYKYNQDSYLDLDE
jgi:hypothetical protein